MCLVIICSQFQFTKSGIVFSSYGALHPRHGPQAFPCFLERRVSRRVWPPRVALSALPRSFFSILLCFGFCAPLLALARTIPLPFSMIVRVNVALIVIHKFANSVFIGIIHNVLIVVY
jgi:hypothetical protein